MMKPVKSWANHTNVEDMTMRFDFIFVLENKLRGISPIWKPSYNMSIELDFLGIFGLSYSFVKIRPLVFFQLTEVKEQTVIRLNPDLLTIQVG